MPQIYFALKKALEVHVKSIAVLNKMDKPNIESQKLVD